MVWKIKINYFFFGLSCNVSYILNELENQYVTVTPQCGSHGGVQPSCANVLINYFNVKHLVVFMCLVFS